MVFPCFSRSLIVYFPLYLIILNCRLDMGCCFSPSKQSCKLQPQIQRISQPSCRCHIPVGHYAIACHICPLLMPFKTRDSRLPSFPLRMPNPPRTLGAAQMAARRRPSSFAFTSASQSGLHSERRFVPGMPPGRNSKSACSKSISPIVVSATIVNPWEPVTSLLLLMDTSVTFIPARTRTSATARHSTSSDPSAKMHIPLPCCHLFYKFYNRNRFICQERLIPVIIIISVVFIVTAVILIIIPVVP